MVDQYFGIIVGSPPMVCTVAAIHLFDIVRAW